MLFWFPAFRFPRGRIDMGGAEIIGFAQGLLLDVVYLIIVVRVIKSYLRSRKRAHGKCRHCGYNLALLTAPRCPECGTGFDPEDVDMPADGAPIEDASTALPERPEPDPYALTITCAQCGSDLPGDGQTGTCANCETAFDRRERIFDTYGPEAFIEELVVEKPKPTTSWAPYRRAIIFSAVAVLSIPVAQYFVDIGAVGADRMPFVIFLFVIAIFEWLRVSRDRQDDARDDTERDDSTLR